MGFCWAGLGRDPQPDLLGARLVANAAERCVLLAEAAVAGPRGLGDVIPVLMGAEDWEEVAEERDDQFLGDAQLWRRPTAGAADPLGGDDPFVSAEGHAIVDVVWEEGFCEDGVEVDAATMELLLDETPGLVTHGLFAGPREAASCGT